MKPLFWHWWSKTPAAENMYLKKTARYGPRAQLDSSGFMQHPFIHPPNIIALLYNAMKFRVMAFASAPYNEWESYEVSRSIRPIAVDDAVIPHHKNFIRYFGQPHFQIHVLLRNQIGTDLKMIIQKLSKNMVFSKMGISHNVQRLNDIGWCFCKRLDGVVFLLQADRAVIMRQLTQSLLLVLLASVISKYALYSVQIGHTICLLKRKVTLANNWSRVYLD